MHLVGTAFCGSRRQLAYVCGLNAVLQARANGCVACSLLGCSGCADAWRAVSCCAVQDSLNEQDMSPECKTEVMKDQNRMAQVGSWLQFCALYHRKVP